MKRFGVILLLFLSGCTTNYLGIGVTTGEAKDADLLDSARTIEVRADDLPAFLGPILVSNFSVAMAEKGLQPVVSQGDLLAVLRYEQEDLKLVPSQGQDHDTFEGRIDQGADTRFVARIVVEVWAKNSDKILWSGSIQRLHNIRPGDYMHTGRASIAFLEAFRDLLSDYPN